MKKTIPIKIKFLNENYYIAVLILILVSLFVIFLQNSVNMTNLNHGFLIDDEQKIKSNPIHSFVPDDFLYFKDITIDDSKVTGSHSDFPILLSLLDSDLQDKAHEDGYDIVFYSITDDEWLEHEIEYYEQYYTSTEAKLLAWINVPTVSESGSSEIRMYFGNSGITSTEENPDEVWSDYGGVWHLSEDPSDDITDSALPYYDGASGGGMDENDLVNGYINKAIDFDGDNDLIEFEDGITLSEDNLSLSFWMKADVQEDMSPVSKYPDDPGASDPGGYAVRLESDGDITFILGNDAEIHDSITATSAYSSTTWLYITCTYERSTGSTKIYLNGTQAATGTITGLTDFDNNEAHLRFGEPDDCDYGENFDGIIDEVRITGLVRSADWIATEYANEFDPENFYSIGPLDGPGVSIAPNVIITSPLDANIYDPPSLTIRATITDDESSVANATATIDNGTTQNVISMSQLNSITWECTWDFSSSSFLAQNYTIIITAQDNWGNTNNTESVTVTIRKDLAAPDITFVNPNEGVFVGDPFAITATITDSAGNDPGDGDVFATIKYGGNPLFNLELERIGVTNNWTAEWSNISLPDYQLGDYTIDITARDTSYYKNEQTIGSRTVTLIDTRAPIVIIDSMYSGPYGQYQTYEEIEIKATITDSKSSVEQAIAMIIGSETFNMTMNFNGAKWTCLWDNITSHTNGQYTITIWTTDSEGNVNQQESITVTINNLLASPPSGDNGAIIIIIGIIAFIGVVGSVGTYGLVRLAKNRKITPNLDNRILKTRKEPKNIEYSPNGLQNLIKEKINILNGNKLESENDTVSYKKKFNLTPLPVLDRSKEVSKIQTQDELLNKTLEKKTAEEKYKLIKQIGKERVNLE